MANNQIKVQFVGTNRLLPYKQDYLAIMDEISRSIVEIAINGKEKTKPILLLDGEPLIFPKTINLIQGKTGTHKSRLAEVLSASFLMKAPLNDVLRNVINPLEFTRLEYLSEYRVVYIDTERDYNELLPDTFNSIRTLSQIQDIDEFTDKFTMRSVLSIGRNDRLDAIRVLLDRECKKFSKEEKTNLIVVLDVISDLTTNFNDIESTYVLSDLLTQMNNIYGVTFICIIHENPDTKSNKARGHLGTEITNKASIIIQVALNGKKNALDQLKITCLKARSTAEFNQISAYYSPEHSRLIRFIPDETSEIKVPNNIKATPDELVQYLEEILVLGKDYDKSYLFPLIETKFNVKGRTIEKRLKDITDNKSTFKFNDEQYLLSTRAENKVKKFRLERKI